MPDFAHHRIPLWYCILMMAVLFSLIRIVRTGLDRSVPMNRSSRIIRVVGGGLWAAIIVVGMIVQILHLG